MATNNFMSKSGRYFVLEDEYIEDMDWDIIVEDIRYKLGNRLGETFDENLGMDDDCLPIGGIKIGKTYGDYEFGLEIRIGLRSGYYSGANIDYEEAYMVNGYGDYYTMDDMIGQRGWKQGDCTEKKFKYYQRCFEKYIDKRYKKTIDKLHKALKDCSTFELNKIAQASNGEAFYQIAN